MSFMLNPKEVQLSNVRILNLLTRDWEGIDHPLWRQELETSIHAITVMLMWMAGYTKRPGSDAAVALLQMITDWDGEEFTQHMRQLNNLVGTAIEAAENGIQ